MDQGGYQLAAGGIQADKKDHGQVVEGEPGDAVQESGIPAAGNQTERNAASDIFRIQEILAYGGGERRSAFEKGCCRSADGVHGHTFLVLVIQGLQIDDMSEGGAGGQDQENIRTHAVIFAEGFLDELSL